MSGAAGLSAAKRRRAPGQSMNDNINHGNRQPVNAGPPPVPRQVNIPDILANHELRLRKYEMSSNEDFEEVNYEDMMDTKVSEVDKNFSNKVETLEKHVQELQTLVTGLRGQLAKMSLDSQMKPSSKEDKKSKN